MSGSRDMDGFDGLDSLSLKGDAAIIAEAKERFKHTLEVEAYARINWLQDLKFVHADAFNGWQWPEKVRLERDRAAKPWLTINKTRQHCMMIKNDAKKNKPAMVAKPVGGDATYRSALAYNAVFRGIESASRAKEVYTIATDHMVDGGWGYWRIMADYVSHDSDKQELFIRPINDPMSVLLDTDITQPDGSDAEFCIIFKDYERREFLRMYPEFKGKPIPKNPLGADGGGSWVGKDKVRVAEYMRIGRKKTRLFTFSMPGDEDSHSLLEEEVPKALMDNFRDGLHHKVRDTEVKSVEWFLIVGNDIHQRTSYKASYIPVVRVVAEEYMLDGKLDRPGHARALRDPQRMYNYWATAATEFSALQTKSPWIAAAESIEGQVDIWKRSNIDNPAVLAYKAFTEDGSAIPPPQKIPPPTGAPAYMQGMQASMQDMTFVSGQYSAMLGEPSNERSGKAIGARQRQGDTATYHYIDGLARAIRYSAIVIMDLLPTIYDTKRVLYAEQPDGQQAIIQIDPLAKQHFQEDLEAAIAVLNPRKGKYQVDAEVGPDWGTKREETFESLTLLLTQAPQLIPKIGDLLMKSADFDLAQEAAERLRRDIPPHLLGQAPDPSILAAQQTAQAATMALGNYKEFVEKTSEENVKLRTELRNKDSQKEIDVYEAITKRIGAMAKANPELGPVLLQILTDSSQINLPEIVSKLDDAAQGQTANGSGAAAAVGAGTLPQQPPAPNGQAPDAVPTPGVLPPAAP